MAGIGRTSVRASWRPADGGSVYNRLAQPSRIVLAGRTRHGRRVSLSPLPTTTPEKTNRPVFRMEDLIQPTLDFTDRTYQVSLNVPEGPSYVSTHWLRRSRPMNGKKAAAGELALDYRDSHHKRIRFGFAQNKRCIVLAPVFEAGPCGGRVNLSKSTVLKGHCRDDLSIHAQQLAPVSRIPTTETGVLYFCPARFKAST